MAANTSNNQQWVYHFGEGNTKDKYLLGEFLSADCVHTSSREGTCYCSTSSFRAR